MRPTGMIVTTPIRLGRLRQNQELRLIIAKFALDNPELDMDIKRPAFLRDPRLYDSRVHEQYLENRFPGSQRSYGYTESSPFICWTAHNPFLEAN
jgi:hypothetical protein